MPEQLMLTPDKYKELGDKYSQLSLSILENDIPKALENNQGIAELREKSDNLFDLAQDNYNKWESLREVEAKRAEDVKRLANAPDNQQTPQEAEAQQKMKAGNSGFKSVGEYLKAVYQLKANNLVYGDGLRWWDGDDRDTAQVSKIGSTKALAENVGATGGFLVPDEFQARVMTVMDTDTIVRPRAQVIRMNRRVVSIPVLDQQGTVAGGASWYGGIVTYYRDESSSLSESSPRFRQIELTAHKLTAMTYASSELLADSAVALQDFLLGDMGFPGALGHRTDDDYLNGSGNGKPEGVLNSGALITTGGASGGVGRVAANDVQYEDLTAMMGKMLPTANTVWVANQSVMTTLLNMAGPSGNPSYLWGSAQAGVPNTLLGRPIIFTDKLPVLGNTGDIMLADFGYYLIGDRQSITIDMSTDNRFEQDDLTWRAIVRHDGSTWLDAPITYKDGSTQVSPFVALGAFST